MSWRIWRCRSFLQGTVAVIAEVIPFGEDRSYLIRAAVEWAIVLRLSPAYPNLKGHLLANEAVEDFCLKAASRVVAQSETVRASDSFEQDPPTEWSPGFVPAFTSGAWHS